VKINYKILARITQMSYLYFIKQSQIQNIMTATVNYSGETSTGYKTKFGEISKSNVIEINSDNQLVITNELFEKLYAKNQSTPKKRFSLREAHGNYHTERNERYNPMTKRFERY
jgi:hypothetical protein